MKNITSRMTELSSVFQKIATMVKLHETMIERIDKDSDDAIHNISQGKSSLMQVYKDVSSNRALIIKVLKPYFLFILVFFLLHNLCRHFVNIFLVIL